MGKRTCLDCGRVIREGSRCTSCQRKKSRAGYDSPTYRAARSFLISRWKMTHGNLCPGWQGTPAHLLSEVSGKLTIDHIIPLSRGGTHAPSNLTVLCLSCNSAKGEGK